MKRRREFVDDDRQCDDSQLTKRPALSPSVTSSRSSCVHCPVWWSVPDEHPIRPWRFADLASVFTFAIPANLTHKTAHQVEYLEALSRDMWAFCQREASSTEEFKAKLQVWAKLQDFLSNKGEWGCETWAFGSTLSNFGMRHSDLDICLFVSANGVGTWCAPKQLSDVALLRDVRQFLQGLRASPFCRSMTLVPAKIPILKLTHRFNQFSIDLSCNNPNSIMSTFLLFHYSQLDPRVRPLVMLLKAWAKNACINDAKDSTLCSYAIILMGLHFLQSGVQPPVVLCLQREFPDLWTGDLRAISEVSFQTRLVPSFRSQNRLSLAELFVNCIDYFANKFDFKCQVGSVRTGSVLSVDECRQYSRLQGLPVRQWDVHICMEDPIDRSNVCRAVIREEKFHQIIKAFKHTHLLLQKKSDFKDLMEPVLPAPSQK